MTPAEFVEDYNRKAFELLERLDSLPKEEQVEKLANWASGDYPKIGGYWSPSTLELAAKAQAVIKTLPGHAEHFERGIEEARAKALEDSKYNVAFGGGVHWGRYDSYRYDTFRSLARMRSDEAVRVLGKLLDDDRDYVSREYLEKYPESRRSMGPSSTAAARSLTLLDIESPPVQKPYHEIRHEDVPTWRLWFAQVKAGTRTYRFKGNPQNYGYAGPVDQELNPSLAVTSSATFSPRGQKQGGSAAMASPTSGATEKTPIVAALLAGLLCLGGLGLVLRNRWRMS